MLSAGRCHPGSDLDRPRLELADIVRTHGPALRRSHTITYEQDRALRDIARCRTADLGGHVDKCADCGFTRPSYNSCRNRHCPKCQGLSQARWLAKRQVRILPVHYFHVVFTLPAELRPIARDNRRLVFDLLFDAASQALLALARDPTRLGAQLGVTAILHTWTRDLRFHPHVHCVVTGGGLSLDDARWVSTKRHFLLPVKALGALFRGKFLAALARAHAQAKLRCAPTARAWHHLLDKLYRHRWVVYSKPPFGGPEQVFAYLGRYTHRVAISNYRLLSMDERGVTFMTRHGATASLDPVEFLKRFIDHVLPPAFVKIRHFGLHAPSNATTRLEHARTLLASARGEPAEPATYDQPLYTLDWRELLAHVTGLDLTRCPSCGAYAITRLPLSSAPLHLARAPPPKDRVS